MYKIPKQNYTVEFSRKRSGKSKRKARARRKYHATWALPSRRWATGARLPRRASWRLANW